MTPSAAPRPEIVIVGTGPGPVPLLTSQAREELLKADRVFFRMSAHPVYHWLRERRPDICCFDLLYATPGIAYEEVYELIASAVVKEACRTGHAVYALPGNPFVFEQTTVLIEQRARAGNIDLRIIPGLSFLEIVYAELRLSPIGIQILNAIDVQSSDPPLPERCGLLIGGLLAHASPAESSGRGNVEPVGRWLQRRFPPTHRISLIWTAGLPDYMTCTKHFTLQEYDRECAALVDAACASLYVPPLVPRRDDGLRHIGND